MPFMAPAADSERAGHADILREELDGATGYPLIAAAEGLGDLGFVQPWTPSDQP
ncbi:hypothetical protein [Tsukamurella sp. PLM1]|uniref:hypothetical protein n=1 Tax=Tsukamurella sp. PLM1 TaxID=2929795 RepID=UPI0020543F27|nr:hypothetical protein [Tsukamurella sp. PLM1]BDH55595.1 hypothetical protein MTP03_05340 [Tsukamurella sp. PLM1]